MSLAAMLVGMDIPAAAGPWIALGVVLGIVLLGLVGLGVALLLRRPSTGAPAPPEPSTDDQADDLADFLEHPPGFPGARRRRLEGWAMLGTPPPPAPAAPGRPVPRRSLGVLALGAALLALVAVAVAVAVWPGDDAPGRRGADRGGPPRAAGELEARLSFGGVVLERRAVGVTATYPGLRLADGRAELELPTYNCLADEAPTDPDGAGCRRTVPEYAELSAPELLVTRTADGWEIRGRFATEVRPNGSGPVPTGRVYELVVTVAAGKPAPRGWRAAEGTLRLGDDQTATTGTDAAAGINVVRSGGR